MWSFIKKLVLVSLIFLAFAWFFNIKIGNKPTRHWTSEFWNSNFIQKNYTILRDKIKALIHQEISLEEVFTSNSSNSKQNNSSQETKQEHFDENDKRALDKIIK